MFFLKDKNKFFYQHFFQENKFFQKKYIIGAKLSTIAYKVQQRGCIPPPMPKVTNVIIGNLTGREYQPLKFTW